MKTHTIKGLQNLKNAFIGAPKLCKANKEIACTIKKPDISCDIY